MRLTITDRTNGNVSLSQRLHLLLLPRSVEVKSQVGDANKHASRLQKMNGNTTNLKKEVYRVCAVKKACSAKVDGSYCAVRGGQYLCYPQSP
jgi:hypothetical protein